MPRRPPSSKPESETMPSAMSTRFGSTIGASQKAQRAELIAFRQHRPPLHTRSRRLAYLMKLHRDLAKLDPREGDLAEHAGVKFLEEMCVRVQLRLGLLKGRGAAAKGTPS